MLFRSAYNGAKAEYEYQRKNYERNRGLLGSCSITDVFVFGRVAGANAAALA